MLRKAALGLLLLLGLVAPVHAHIPISTNPFVQAGCTTGFPNLDDSWAVLGVFTSPQQVGIFCFDGTPGLHIKATLVIPPKAAYEGPNDVTMALVGPGLPVPDRTVPLGLKAGQGAVFAQLSATGGPFPKRNYLGWWHGEILEVEVPDTGRYEVRVFSPSGWKGEYDLVTTGNDPTLPSGNLDDTPVPTPGDLDGNGTVDEQDAFQALYLAIGQDILQNTFVLSSADVAPPGDPDQFIVPGDGVIDLGDVVRIFRRALGLDTSEYWPDEG